MNTMNTMNEFHAFVNDYFHQWKKNFLRETLQEFCEFFFDFDDKFIETRIEAYIKFKLGDDE